MCSVRSREALKGTLRALIKLFSWKDEASVESTMFLSLSTGPDIFFQGTQTVIFSTALFCCICDRQSHLLEIFQTRDQSYYLDRLSK